MTANGWFQILVFLALIFLVTKPMGIFMARVFSREKTFMDPALRPIERLLRAVDARDVELIDAQNPDQTDVRAIACAVLLLPEMQKPANRLTLVAEKSLELPRTGWISFSLTLQNSLAASGVAKVTRTARPMLRMWAIFPLMEPGFSRSRFKVSS